MAKMRNCPVCGRVYVDMGTGAKMCRDCYEKEKEMEEVVARFVRDHQGSSIKEICEKTGIEEKIVFRMVKEGRFIQAGVKVSYPCESCGALITKGRFCEKCQSGLVKQLQEQNAKIVAAKQSSTNRAPRGMYSKDMGIK